jgi:hypothetical protein
MIHHFVETSPSQLSDSPLRPQPEADSPLLALELQFDALSAQLHALESTRRDRKRSQPAAAESEQSQGNTHLDEQFSDEAATCRIEEVLAHLYPIEQAIVQTRACTIAGLGVKARHAAHVMSEYWEGDLDQIDWDAKAIRGLIEAVCDIAGKPLRLHNSGSDE